MTPRPPESRPLTAHHALFPSQATLHGSLPRHPAPAGNGAFSALHVWLKCNRGSPAPQNHAAHVVVWLGLAHAVSSNDLPLLTLLVMLIPGPGTARLVLPGFFSIRVRGLRLQAIT